VKSILLIILIGLSLDTASAQRYSRTIIVGAEQTEQYVPSLRGKKIAMLVNQTSRIGKVHLVDTLQRTSINIVRIFAPEHGFRGGADAGATIKNGIDSATGIPITSMYGPNKKPEKQALKGIEVVVFDIQDVGARFYTYISSLQYMMEACADNNIPMIILDRPNPNGFYVDGPVLKPAFKSFVGMQPIPVVHGMTVGEYAKMLLGEKWLNTKNKLKLTVVPCKQYNHTMLYALPVPPSPNLKTPTAVLLYPSLCFFEGTDVSVGRGTETPFEVWGHPTFNNNGFSFTPTARAGASNPPHKDKPCYGADLRLPPADVLKITEGRISLSFLKNALLLQGGTSSFFNAFFDKLAGTDQLKQQLLQGLSEEAIRATWEKDLKAFKAIRKKYLLYPDFTS
jgi:uncharacterized protein YbbC (DUF1343 family)